MNPQYKILLYYKYTTIRNPEKFRDEQRALCEKLGFTGRIIVAREGINGTLEGTEKNVKKYVSYMNKLRGFKNIHWKLSEGTGDAFPKLSIKARPEIVSLTLGKKDIDPREITGKYLSPEQLRTWFEKGKKFKIVDMRNDYEHWVGHFKGSILPPMKHFRELPKFLPKLKKHKNETVLTVCTGGVRCEKASGLLVANGFKDVYQLSGGIVSYMKKYPGKDWLGSLYTFDKRKTMTYETDPARVPIGKCKLCKAPTENFGDCMNMQCHKQFLICKDCEAQGKTGCSVACEKKVLKVAPVAAK